MFLNFRIGNINLYLRKIALLKMLAHLWDELEEREEEKFKNIHEKGDSLTEKEKKEEGRFREGGHQRMQVKEERVTGR